MKVPRVRRFNPRMQEEIEWRLLAGDFRSYRALAAELKLRGCHIGKSALHAHRQRLLAALSQSKNKKVKL